MTKPEKVSADTWAYCILIGITMVLLYPVIFSREQTFFIIGDNVHLAYPFLNKLCISLHKGYMPLWDANTFGGKNFPGELQTGAFYPLSILWCYLFGSVKGIDVYHMDLLIGVHFLIGVFGMYRLARVFRFMPTAAVGSALVFCFTGVLAARSGCETFIFYGLCLLPWGIYFVSKYYWEQPRKKWLVFAGLVCGGQILAGHVQPFFHTVLIGFIIILFYEYRRRRNWTSFAVAVSRNMALILCFALLLAFPQVYYAGEYLLRAYREVGGNVYIDPTHKLPLYIYLYWYTLNPTDIGNFIGQKSVILGDYNFIYMGILPFFLFVNFLLRARFMKMSEEHTVLKNLLVIILVFGSLAVLGYLTFLPYLLHAIPFVSGIRELSRYAILICFSDALLVGLALNYIDDLGTALFGGRTKISLYILWALILNALYWIVAAQQDISLDVSIPYLLASGSFLVLLTMPRYPYTRLIAIGVILIDLFLNPVFYSSTRSFLYPPNTYGRNRIVDSLEGSYGKYRTTFNVQAHVLTKRNIGDIYNIQTKWGYAGTANRLYYNFLNVVPNPWKEVDTLSNPELDDLLNIRYVLAERPLDSSYIFRDSVPYFYLYERRNWYPRCYWKHQLGETGREIEAENAGSIRQLAYSDLYQKWEIQCSSSDTLIFSENSYPAWTCFDNQRKVPIYQPTIKNYPPLFRAIPLEPGHHIIEFRYKKTFYWF